MNKTSIWILIVFWIVTVCLLSGALAAILDMPSLWGRQVSVLEYLLPLPFSWGMLHYPGLALFGTGLAFAASKKGQWLIIFRYLCIGTLIAIVCVAIFNNAIVGFPLFMFMSVDAATALIFAGMIREGVSDAEQISMPTVLVSVLGPSALVMIGMLMMYLLMDRYNFARSDTEDISVDQDVVRFWLYLNRSAKNPKDECRHLKKYAKTRQNAYARNDKQRHRKILLFKDKQAYRSGSDDAAWVIYEWWPDGRIYCSADPNF